MHWFSSRLYSRHRKKTLYKQVRKSVMKLPSFPLMLNLFLLSIFLLCYLVSLSQPLHPILCKHASAIEQERTQDLQS